MTTGEVAASALEERGIRRQDAIRAVACAFCRRRLANEYFFTCLFCKASYCYIHMSRHAPALCARQAGRRRRAGASSTAPRRDVRLPLWAGNQLLLTRPEPGGSPSANV